MKTEASYPDGKLCFEDLFRFWYRPLCVYALHYLGSIEKSEDIVQECYMSLWEKAYGMAVENKEGKSADVLKNPKSYLYTMVRNRCIDLLRKNRSSPGHDVSISSLSDEEDFIRTEKLYADDLLQEDSVIEAHLWTVLDTLPEKCREIFLMAKRDGLRYDEIAEDLDISENTVRNQVSKALKIIKNGVKKAVYFLFGL